MPRSLSSVIPFRYLAVLAVAFLLLVITWSFFAADLGRQQDPPLSFGSITADAQFEEITYDRYEGGRLEWTLKADRASFFEDREIFDLEKVVVLADQGGRGQVEIRSDSGTYDMKMEDMSLAGHVLVSTPDGRTLATTRLFYVRKDRLIRSDDPVLIKGHGLLVKGTGFEYHLDTGVMTVRRQQTTLDEGSGVTF